MYTAIFGGYDELNDVPKPSGVDMICFTDNQKLRHPHWQVRVVAPPYAHPRLAAKYYKALPHLVLAEYDETIWIDGSFRVKDENFPAEVFGYLEHASIALFLHPDRGCIYDEAAYCKGLPKYASQDILGQVEHYRALGYPPGAGLFACGVIARRTHDRTVRRLGELWMEENRRWTYQDQLSLPYLMWKLDLHPAIFRQNLWKNRWGTWKKHAHNL